MGLNLAFKGLKYCSQYCVLYNGKCLQPELLHCLLQSDRCSQNGIVTKCVTYRCKFMVSGKKGPNNPNYTNSTPHIYPTIM
jgi:hypothetical protein